MATIMVKEDWATVTIVDIDPDEGTLGWICTCGDTEIQPDASFETYADVINAADVHLSHRCRDRAWVRKAQGR
jgi:hypothetical protein